MYPQRPMLLGPMFAAGAAGTVPSGRLQGKVIIVSSLLDREATPWQAEWYRRRFDQLLGRDGPNRYRLWYMDHALHGYNEDRVDRDRSISYLGALHHALRDFSAWVEEGTPPPANTSYRIVAALIAAAPGTGKVVSARRDLDGTGQFAAAAILPASPSPRTMVRRTGALRQAGNLFRYAQGRKRARRQHRLALCQHPEPGAGVGGGQVVSVSSSRVSASGWVVIA